MMELLRIITIISSILLVAPKGSDSSKILLLSPAAGSHFMNFEQIARALIYRGHEVHTYLNKDCKSVKKMTDLGVKLHTYSTPNGCFQDDKRFMDDFTLALMNHSDIFSFLDIASTFGDKMKQEAFSFLGDDVTIKNMHGIGFDLCILDGFAIAPFLRIIPYKLDIPVASFLAVFDPGRAGVPGLPSFTPYINFGKFTNEMTFWERIQNTFMTYIFDAFTQFMNQLTKDELISKFAPEKPVTTFTELEKKSVLWFVMTDIAVDYPQVRMPHVIDIGGMNTRPPMPLSEDLKRIADGATNGLILVSFGAQVNLFPEYIKQTLLGVFKELNQTIIWRFTPSSTDNVPDNVHAADWIPQNDLLAHPNTKLFITHCGANGQFEALYNGVPMLGLPIFGDQFYNSLRMEKKGLGIHMELLKVKHDQLLEAVKEMLTNDTYSKTMAIHSEMFKERAMTPMETLIYWVEHVIKYGSNHLVSPAIEMPWYSYWCLDVGVFFSLIAIMITFCGYLLLKCVFSLICKLRKNKEKQN